MKRTEDDGRRTVRSLGRRQGGVLLVIRLFSTGEPRK
jgi:hypothetical protein